MKIGWFASSYCTVDGVFVRYEITNVNAKNRVWRAWPVFDDTRWKRNVCVRSPHGARVSGVVEETPGRLEYEVALYKEAPARLTNLSHNSELPVDQAVPIGTKLQLRARINPHSGTNRRPSR